MQEKFNLFQIIIILIVVIAAPFFLNWMGNGFK